jgi:subtilisin family serine protease
MKLMSILIAALFSGGLYAADAAPGDYLVKVAPGPIGQADTLKSKLPEGSIVEDLGINGWHHVKVTGPAATTFNVRALRQLPFVMNVTKNGIIKLMENPVLKDPAVRARLISELTRAGGWGETPPPDNPEIKTPGMGGTGADPLFSKQWGMNQIGVQTAWGFSKGAPEIIVAVIDTGVDYNHEDLIDNMWRNPGEIAGNGVDDDKNGYVDDIVGWDFAAKDNKPYDLTASIMEMLTGGGNPGHGTHCAGNVAARGDNGKGIAGVAPNVRIMALRFITEKGQGTTADAVAAIKYAIDNGARVTSNSWGSSGEDANDPDTQALKDAIAYSEHKGVLFVAAAGNGDQMGKGYDNDTNAKPAYPASYPNDIIVSVAAIDSSGNLGTFSNWGARSVDIGAPGVKVFSTITLSDKYSDTVVDIPGLITAYWDGTSMATPHVAGAAALYLSYYPNKTWRDVKNALMMSVKKTSVLTGKTTSGGQLDVQNLMRF